MVHMMIKKQIIQLFSLYVKGFHKITQDVDQVGFEPPYSIFVAGQGWKNLFPVRTGIQGRLWGREYEPLEPHRSG